MELKVQLDPLVPTKIGVTVLRAWLAYVSSPAWPEERVIESWLEDTGIDHQADIVTILAPMFDGNERHVQSLLMALVLTETTVIDSMGFEKEEEKNEEKAAMVRVKGQEMLQQLLSTMIDRGVRAPSPYPKNYRPEAN